jgi:glycosyltransferase involved in cell wall biosynthesis
MMARIGIDASRSIAREGKTGVELVSDALLAAMDACVPPQVEVMYYTPELIPWLPTERQRVVAGRRLWSAWHLPRMLSRERLNRFFAPVHVLPLFGLPRRVAHVLHDVAFLREPRAYTWFTRCYLRFDLWRMRRRGAQAIVPTQVVARDVAQRGRVDARHIAVVPWAALPLPEVPSVAREHIVLFVGRLEWKKNVDGLLAAFAQFRAHHPDWELVLLGKPGVGYERFAAELEAPGVRVLGYVGAHEKAAWFARASVYAAVSREEGSSLPVLEAMSAGVPVLAGAHPVFAEVAGNAALFAASNDPEAIASALARLADDPALQADLARRGHARAAERTWAQVAHEMWRVVLGDYGAEYTNTVLPPMLNQSPAVSRALSRARAADHQ